MKSRPRIAVVKGDFSAHSESWESRWIDILNEARTNYSHVNWRDRDGFSELLKHDVVLWSFSHYSQAERVRARDILFALEQAGVAVFPGFSDAWHYDNKIAQSYLFEALRIETPRAYTLFSKNDVDLWAKEVGSYPIVAKLAGGSGSHNVRLIKNEKDLRIYSERSFGRGVDAGPGIFLKVRSNIRSSRSFKQFLQRAKRIPDYLITLRQSRNLELERGYVYLQEFVSNAKYDLKIAVVNEKLGFIVRDVRPGDFRASGGGALHYDRALVTPDIIDLAFRLYDRMGTMCTGMDIVVDTLSRPLVIETSAFFSAGAMLAGGGFFDRSGLWHQGSLDAPNEIVNALMRRFEQKQDECS